MKKTISILCVIIFAVLLLGGMCACDDGESVDLPTPPANINASTETNKADDYNANDYNANEEKDRVHYLIFKIDEKEVARLATSEGDTYEDLEIFFPTIPDTYAGYVWEKLDVVYSNSKELIEINAILGELDETDTTETSDTSSETED